MDVELHCRCVLEVGIGSLKEIVSGLPPAAQDALIEWAESEATFIHSTQREYLFALIQDAQYLDGIRVPEELRPVFQQALGLCKGRHEDCYLLLPLELAL